VDVTLLPDDPAAWPRVGDESEFEVLQHRGEQMRLWPTDPAWRGRTHWLDDQDWSAVTNALRVGDVVRGRMTQVFTANRECSVDLDVVTAIAEWSGDAPAVRQERQVLVKTVLDTTRRVLIDLA
jgi:hypothetical protein